MPKNALAVLLILLAIPVIYLMGFKGLTFSEMLQKIGIKKGED